MNKENNLTSQKENNVNKEFICPLCKMNTPLIQGLYIDQKTKSPFVSLICKCNAKNERFDISLSKMFYHLLYITLAECKAELSKIDLYTIFKYTKQEN